MRYAIIENGVVVNIAEAEPEFAAEKGWIELPDGIGIGCTYDGESFSQPEANAASPSSSDVDTERDRRVAAGFDFNGVRFQTRPEDRENMAGASLVALAAMTAGAQPGDFRWHGGSSDFVWIAEDNSLHPMDAQTMFTFGQAAMAHKQALIFKARAIKDMEPVPADFADDGYWQ